MRGSRTLSRRIVALGGGHGLYATLSAARRLTPHVTAVVTVADDGGSSGRLRSELDVVPPGDLRMALAALASDSPHQSRTRPYSTSVAGVLIWKKAKGETRNLNTETRKEVT